MIHRDAHDDPDAWLRERPERLHGLDLRYVLTDLVHQPLRRRWAVKELVAELTAAGFDLGEHPNKVVADHLRTELSRGRVHRVAWGVYQAGTMPASTGRRIRKRARLRRDWLSGRGGGTGWRDGLTYGLAP